VPKPTTPKWYVHEDQKIKGPYTPYEIQILLNEGKIRGKSLISGGPKSNHSKTVDDLVKNLSDPVYSLFGTLQFAENLTRSFNLELARTPLKHYRSKVGLLLKLGFCLLLLLIVTIIYMNSRDPGTVNPFLPLTRRPVATQISPVRKVNPPVQKPVENFPEKIRNEEPSPSQELSRELSEDMKVYSEPLPPASYPDSGREPASFEDEGQIDTPIPPPMDPPVDQPPPPPENPPETYEPPVDLSE
jgi:hypothetical protein